MGAVLSQITPALAETVEVIVLDNASPDDTPDVVMRAQTEFPGIALAFLRRPLNIGPDANFCDAPAQAHGLFLYLISDDDILLPGAVECLVTLIRRHPDLDAFALNTRGFRRNSDEEASSVYFLLKDRLLTDRDDALQFLKVHLTFLSCIAFRRENVVARDYRPFFSTNLAQSYMFLDALAPGRGLYAVKQIYLAQRLENNEGYNFFEVFVSNFAALMQYAIQSGYSPEAVQAVLRHQLKYVYHMILLFKYRGSFGSIHANYADALRRLHRVYGWNGFVCLVLAPIMAAPAGLFPPLQRFYQRIKGYAQKAQDQKARRQSPQ